MRAPRGGAPGAEKDKGPAKKMIVSESELVAALRGVDYVIVFGDATAGRLLRLLEPDVHCKGTDYAVDTVPERAIVQAYGGRTAIVGDSKSHSTRDLLARLARG